MNTGIAYLLMFTFFTFQENFLLTMGALMYIGAASLELAALDSVQPSLVMNAAVLGVISLITGLIFIIDLLLAGKRRKRPSNRIRTLGYDKPTQTETTGKMYEATTNGVNVANGFKKVPTNGVKILPTSPTMEEMAYPKIPVTNSNNEFVGTITPPIFTPQELKSPKVKIRSTESFLRSEKGEMPVVRSAPSSEKVFIPPGFMLVPAKNFENEAHTPPGYASVDQKFGVMAPRKLQSPTVTTTARTPTGYYYQDSREPSPTENTPPNEEYGTKYPPPMQERPWSALGPKQKSYPDEADSPFRRNSPFRSSKQNLPDRRYGNELVFPVDVEDSSLNGHKIDEELRRIKDITKSDIDLTAEIAKENQALKHILRKEKEEKQKLRVELKKSELEERKRLEDRVNELEEYQTKLEKELKIEERKKLEQKIKELEEEKDRRMSEKEVQYFGVNDLRQSKKETSPIIHPKLSDIEEYFKAESEKAKGVKEINSKLKEKNSERPKDDEELRKVIEEGFHFLDEEERKKRSGQLLRDVEERRSLYKRREMEKKGEDWKEDEFPSRGDTPGGASYKSEAQFWLGGKEQPPPISPKDPGYVLHTVQNWPDPSSASPTDRFRFSSRKAQQSFKIEPSMTPSPEFPERGSSEEEDPRVRGRSQDGDDRMRGRGRGLLLRKVDFPEDPVTGEMDRPNTVAGSTSTWRRWLQNSNKTKLHATRSTPQ